MPVKPIHPITMITLMTWWELAHSGVTRLEPVSLERAQLLHAAAPLFTVTVNVNRPLVSTGPITHDDNMKRLLSSSTSP
jgi:hypothetical protein